MKKRIEINEDNVANVANNEDNVASKNLYERYLELKGDSKNAPDGVARKLMREFQIIGMNKYYKELRESKQEYEALLDANTMNGE